jgi:predicted small integral membrane protein
MMKTGMTAQRWNQIYLTIIAAMALILAALVWAVPVVDGEKDWTGQMVQGGWMAWTFPVALFFFIIASLLITFTLLAIRFPEVPSVGILRIETTRGDRLFISLLGSAFINLGWLFFFGAPLFGALIICVFYAAAVFRWV